MQLPVCRSILWLGWFPDCCSSFSLESCLWSGSTEEPAKTGWPGKPSNRTKLPQKRDHETENPRPGPSNLPAMSHRLLYRVIAKRQDGSSENRLVKFYRTGNYEGRSYSLGRFVDTFGNIVPPSNPQKEQQNFPASRDLSVQLQPPPSWASPPWQNSAPRRDRHRLPQQNSPSPPSSEKMSWSARS